MPLFDFRCDNCGEIFELLVATPSEKPTCFACGSSNIQKLLSAPSSMSGAVKPRVHGSGDTACCGSSPGQAACAGPGSCCGKTF